MVPRVVVPTAGSNYPASLEPATVMLTTDLRGVTTLHVVKQSAPLIHSAAIPCGMTPAPKKLQNYALTAAMRKLAIVAILLEMSLLAVMI